MADTVEQTLNTGGENATTPIADTSSAIETPAEQAAPATEWKANNVSDESLSALMAAKGISPELLDETEDEDTEIVIEDETDDQATAAGVDGETPEALNEGQDEEEGKEPKTVPYNRLKEKIDEARANAEKAAALQTQLEEITAKQAAEQQAAQVRQVLETRAKNAHFDSVEKYMEADQWARTPVAQGGAGSTSIEDWLALEDYKTQIQNNFSLDDEAKAEMIQVRKERLETQALQRNLQETQQFQNQQIVEREIEAAKSDLGVLSPELERQFRDSRISPQVVRETVKLFKAQAAPMLAAKDAEIADRDAQIVAYETAFKELEQKIPGALKEHSDNAVAKAAARRTLQTRTPSPEGAGGTPPRPATAQPTNWKQNVGRPLKALMDAAGGRKG